jgi:hypothetical protein
MKTATMTTTKKKMMIGVWIRKVTAPVTVRNRKRGDVEKLSTIVTTIHSIMKI